MWYYSACVQAVYVLFFPFIDMESIHMHNNLIVDIHAHVPFRLHCMNSIM